MKPHPAFSVPILSLLASISVLGCTRHVEVDRDRGPQAYYQTGFPVHDTSGPLERAMASVKRISVTAVYDTYLFPEAAAPTTLEAPREALLARATDTVTVHRTRAATAVVVSRSGRRLLLLGTHHAVHRPDTIIQYFDREMASGASAASSRPIRSISVLTHRSNWVLGLPSLGPFELLAHDASPDLAFLGVEYPRDEDPRNATVLPVNAGNPNRLSWGSFVYVLGHPGGYPMVTRGVVSDPRREATDAFVIDGLWNEGMSGGLVLAVRGQGGDLEWVGMARASAAATEHRLAPPEGAVEEHDLWRPYEGPIYLEEVRRIQYGITLAVPMDRIRRFADQHRSELRRRGYDVPRF
jgi:hypothetical protein